MLFRNLWTRAQADFVPMPGESIRLPKLLDFHQIDLFLSLYFSVFFLFSPRFGILSLKEFQICQNQSSHLLCYLLEMNPLESTCILVWLPADALSSGHINGMVLRTSSMPGLSFCSGERTPMFHCVFQYTLSCKILSRFGGQVWCLLISCLLSRTPMLNDRSQWWGMVRHCC